MILRLDRPSRRPSCRWRVRFVVFRFLRLGDYRRENPSRALIICQRLETRWDSALGRRVWRRIMEGN